jgi:hypothetical protein
MARPKRFGIAFLLTLANPVLIYCGVLVAVMTL